MTHAAFHADSGPRSRGRNSHNVFSRGRIFRSGDRVRVTRPGYEEQIGVFKAFNKKTNRLRIDFDNTSLFIDKNELDLSFVEESLPPA